MSAVPDQPFLEARHIDDLTTAVRALNTTIARAEEARSRDHRALLAAIERLASHTENLPALMDELSARSNGHAQEDDNGG